MTTLVPNITVTPSGCWEWQGRRDIKGYGFFGQHRVHRLVYAMVHGDIPPGMIIHHTCENSPCVNPDHLVLLSRHEHCMTHAELRLEDDTAVCRHGHPRAENAFMEGKVRRCRACRLHQVQARRKTPLGESNFDRAKANICKHGHSLDDAWIDRNGTRKCRTCNRERQRARNARLREENPPQPKPPSTTCKNGHVYDETGVYLYRGKRFCMECRREADWRRRAAVTPS